MGFNKSPGAYVDTEYPDDISDRLSLKTSDMMNIYAIHRMRNMKPNFIQMKVAGVSVASFYTGFSFKHYVGKPDFAVTVFLSDEDNPTTEFEGMLRRIAYDLLPQREDLLFDQMLVNYYDRLKDEDLEPFWEEYIEGEGSKIATIHADEDEPTDEIKQKEKQEAEPEFKMEDLDFDEQFDLIEKEELKEEIQRLKELVNRKNEKIKTLTDQLASKVSKESGQSEEVQLLQEQLNEANDRLDDWSEKLADLSEKNTILMETVNKLTEMSMQQNEEMERQGREILDLKKTLEAKDEEIEELNNQVMNTKLQTAQSKELDEQVSKMQEKIDTLKQKNEELEEEKERLSVENGALLQSTANLKIEIKQLKEMAEEKVEDKGDLTDEIIELKKNIKVLRRERNHYRDIVRENDLL